MRPTKRTIGQNDSLDPLAEGYYNNLHHIAISNLNSEFRRIQRWWIKKYKRPTKEFEEHTKEELLIEMLEDFYERNPDGIKKFLETEKKREDDWDGTMSEEYERSISERLKKVWKRNEVDLSRWKSERQLSEDEEKNLLENLGRRLPGSTKVTQGEPSLGDGEEFDEDFS